MTPPQGKTEPKHHVRDDVANLSLKNFTYHVPKEGQLGRYKLISAQGLEFAVLLSQNCPASRELSLAMTKLEEAVMWANASIGRAE